MGLILSSASRRETRRRVTRMVLAIITVYVVCWLPYWVFQVSPAHPSLSQRQVRLCTNLTSYVYDLTSCVYYDVRRTSVAMQHYGKTVRITAKTVKAVVMKLLG